MPIVHVFPSFKVLPRKASRATRLDYALAEMNAAHDALESVHEALSELKEDLTPEEAQAIKSILDSAETLYTASKSDVEDLKNEMEEWRDNMEEHFSATQKYDTVSQTAETLSDALDSLEIEEAVWDVDTYIPADRSEKLEELENAVQAISDFCSTIETAEFPGARG